jgi:hypothetical protein
MKSRPPSNLQRVRVKGVRTCPEGHTYAEYQGTLSAAGTTSLTIGSPPTVSQNRAVLPWGGVTTGEVARLKQRMKNRTGVTPSGHQFYSRVPSIPSVAWLDRTASPLGTGPGRRRGKAQTPPERRTSLRDGRSVRAGDDDLPRSRVRNPDTRRQQVNDHPCR